MYNWFVFYFCDAKILTFMQIIVILCFFFPISSYHDNDYFCIFAQNIA